jgi:putative heme-binding domain-containing protein
MPFFNETNMCATQFPLAGRRWRDVLFGALVIGASHVLAAPEPWADPRLPATNGLEVWLDASRQNDARQARQLPALADGRAVDFWFDASGHRFDLAQRLPAARPRFKVSAGGPFVRFDGKDDFLAAVHLRRALTNATIFMVAAPRSNTGLFRALLGINASGRNDFLTGLNLDQGPGASAAFTTLNAEGAGFPGARNLLTNAATFGTFHLIALTCEPGAGGVRLFVDGAAHSRRERAHSELRMDELTVGARCYSNVPEPPHTQGFLEGDIAEILIFNRVLPDAERAAVERYLAEKHGALRPEADEQVPGGLRRLEVAANPPPVQMLVPGFTVRELPVLLNNINSLKYRGDGRLVALGYNGRIYLLTDTDGDGLEDKAELFWDRDTLRSPIGMALTPPGYARGEGVFVAAKGKLALILDRDRDGRADEEIIVADGWKELPHGVDALGVALDREGNIYFGLGCVNFTDAYLVDRATGQSRYDLRNEHGTILKVSPDFQRREIVCTGVRFPVALSFNRYGDLFCTDQEGATWLSNGNPLDELLHIQAGRHYGFPPRHPKHLPNVIDEPSVFDYAPQHQSTCGLNFNEPVNGGPIFGPAAWAGDALVSGESRGKLWRTKLVKTHAGYVAQNQLLACLSMLTIDACVSPRGELVVACHSGQPDWGSGPDGKGKLYQIRYSEPSAPQPVLAWSASPAELRIAFDRPLDPANLRNLTKQISIVRGPHAQPGDRYESIRPGYQVVQDQLSAPRYDVPVLSASITADRRTLMLATPPQTAAMNYSITLPASISGAATAEPRKFTPTPHGVTETSNEKAKPVQDGSHAQLELLADLGGVEAHWQAKTGGESWSGWLPHPDLTVARALVSASAEHGRLWELIRKPGTLTLRGQLNLWQMLRPAIQPGSKVDYQLPDESVAVTFNATSRLAARKPEPASDTKLNHAKENTLSLTHHPAEGRWLPFELMLETGAPDLKLEVAWHTSEDARPRALALRRLLVPWASPKPEPAPLGGERQIPELAGGHWLHGKRVFFSEAAACSKCHTVHGQGSKLGPDLSNLIHRDYASVLRDIREPSAAINPDHVAWHAALKDGEMLTGVLLADSREQITLGDAAGQSNVVLKARLLSLKPSPVSLMPEGIDKTLGEAAMKDLLTFLLTSPLEPAPIELPNPPPPRTRTDVEAVLNSSRPEVFGAQKSTNDQSRVPSAVAPLHIVLCAGPKDHGPGEHDYPLWQRRWEKLLSLADGVKVSTAQVWPTLDQWRLADVIVFYSNNPGWNASRAPELDAFLERGGGLVYLHYAVDGQKDVEALASRIGLAWRGGSSKFRHGALDLKLHAHPLAAGFAKLDFVDESYWQLVGDEKNIQLLATGLEEGKPRPLIWTRQQGKGRIFVSILGHYTWTFDDPLFRLLVLRGVCWSANQPMDRLGELATVGARITD